MTADVPVSYQDMCVVDLTLTMVCLTDKDDIFGRASDSKFWDIHSEIIPQSL